jgi:RHS repeat-associated protein
LLEPHLGWYFLGNGYRAYNPTLMRFHSPDSWSPFGRGGLNAYMYCVGDPVNSSDPTGHSRIGKLLWGAYDFLFGGPGATGSGRPLADFGPMSPEKTGEFTGLMIAGAPVAAAPGPRGDIISEGARMTSVAHENRSRIGYVDGAALAGLTALGNRSIIQSAPPNLNLANRPSVVRHQFGRDAITITYSDGRSVTRPRQPVRGGSGRGTNTSGSASSTSRQPMSDAEHTRVEYNTWLRVRGAQLQRQGYTSPSFIEAALRFETPAELRRIRTEVGIRRQGSGH